MSIIPIRMSCSMAFILINHSGSFFMVMAILVYMCRGCLHFNISEASYTALQLISVV